MMPVKHLIMTVPLKCKTFTFCLAVPRLCICRWSWIKEHHWMTGSILQKLLVLYLAIIYSRQLQVVRSREKKSFIISQGFFTDLNLFFLFFYYFYFFNWIKPVYLVSCTKRMLYSEQPTVLLARRHLNTVILTIFENLNSILNIFQETHNFLVLTDPSIICIYLRTTDKHFCDQGKVRYPTSKLPKWDLLQTLDTFRNPSLRILEGISCSIRTIIMFFSLNFIRIWISLHSLTIFYSN